MVRVLTVGVWVLPIEINGEPHKVMSMWTVGLSPMMICLPLPCALCWNRKWRACFYSDTQCRSSHKEVYWRGLLRATWRWRLCDKGMLPGTFPLAFKELGTGMKKEVARVCGLSPQPHLDICILIPASHRSTIWRWTLKLLNSCSRLCCLPWHCCERHEGTGAKNVPQLFKSYSFHLGFHTHLWGRVL